MSYGNSKTIKVRLVNVPDDEKHKQENELVHAETVIQLSNTLKNFDNLDIWYVMTLAGINPVEVAGISSNVNIDQRLDNIETMINGNAGLIMGKLKKLEKAVYSK